MIPLWYTKQGRLFVQISQFEAFELEPKPGFPPDMWTWHALPWDYFSRLGVSKIRHDSDLRSLARTLTDELEKWEKPSFEVILGIISHLLKE